MMVALKMLDSLGYSSICNVLCYGVPGLGEPQGGQTSIPRYIPLFDESAHICIHFVIDSSALLLALNHFR